jgi:hypothetical protein
MKKETCLKAIQKRLPDDLILQDETTFEFTDDEYVVILSWLKLFNQHYRKNGKSRPPQMKFPIISKRLYLDLGLYFIPNDAQENHGKHIIYLSPNGQLLNGTIKKNVTVREVINTWDL